MVQGIGRHRPDSQPGSGRKEIVLARSATEEHVGLQTWGHFTAVWPLDSFLTFLSFPFLISQAGKITGSQHGGRVTDWQNASPLGQNHFPPLAFTQSHLITSGSPPGGGSFPEFGRCLCFQHFLIRNLASFSRDRHQGHWEGQGVQRPRCQSSLMWTGDLSVPPELHVKSG